MRAMSTISSREFSQDASRAKRAARKGPVFITDRGRPAHVLMTVELYQRLAGGQPSIVDLLAGREAGTLHFDPPRLGADPLKPVDLD